MLSNRDIISRLTESHSEKNEESKKIDEEDTSGEGFTRPTEMYPPKVRKFIENHGESRIIHVEVARTPLTSIIEKSLAFITLGRSRKKMKELNIDKMRHLYAVLQIVNRSGEKSMWLLEKDEVIKVHGANTSNYPRPNQETLVIGTPRKHITVANLFNTLLAEDPNINIYDAVSANCQLFVEHILKILGVWNPSAESFVKQNIRQLISPFIQRIARKITDTARTANIIIEGAGEGKYMRGGCNGMPCESACGGVFIRDAGGYRNKRQADESYATLMKRAQYTYH